MRQVNEELEAQITQNRPELEVLFNGANNIELKLPRPEEFDFTPVPYPKKMSTKDVPSELKDLIEEDSIKKYNQSLPPKAEVDRYNRERE
ncbi:MAG: hypothetical protein GWN01_01695, partial [Nitrosopumilaceae archaeon]|nr:hypothetical protein [Nitrosopumilaceae archaeon]NIV64825.1 hypothetical protein [Nitrosopumilaceae archaeon]NIX60291.1 hypothetical protein [Nitrosopumilaceae archaeon]